MNATAMTHLLCSYNSNNTRLLSRTNDSLMIKMLNAILGLAIKNKVIPSQPGLTVWRKFE